MLFELRVHAAWSISNRTFACLGGRSSNQMKR